MRVLVLHMRAAVALFTWVLCKLRFSYPCGKCLPTERLISEPHTFVLRWVSELFVEHRPLGYWVMDELMWLASYRNVREGQRDVCTVEMLPAKPEALISFSGHTW